MYKEYPPQHPELLCACFYLIFANLLHNYYALLGSSIHIHVVNTSSSSANDLELISCTDDFSCNLCCRSHHQSIIVLEEHVSL